MRMTTGLKNLDADCAALGQKIADARGLEEKTVIDALHVLEGDGLYAMFLWLDAQTHQEGADRDGSGTVGQAQRKLISHLRGFLEGQGLISVGPGSRDEHAKGRDERKLDRDRQIFPALRTLAEDLDTLLFAHDLVRRTLVYARYHTRARMGRR